MKRRQLNVTTCLSTRTVNTSCSIYTLAGSQRLTQDVRERQTTLYVVRTNLRLRTTFEGTLSCTTTTTRHMSASQLARDFVDAARDRRFLVSRLTIIVRHPTSIFQHVASGFNGSCPTTAFRPSSSSVFRPPSSGFHLASPTSYRTVARYVFVCCCAFVF